MLDYAAWAEAHPILLALALVVLFFGPGRLSRIIVHDDYPPANWVRVQWDRITNDGPWAKLFHCPWCMTPWITVICLAWGILSNLHWSWWLFWGWLAAAYISTIIIGRDEQRE